jgi:polar amino acid transport system substrate-binding protein
MRWRALWVLCLGWVAAGLHAETLVVFGGDTFAPSTYLLQGKPAGNLVDILKKVSEKTGDTYQIRLYPWKRAYDYALRGDGAILGLSMTPERQELFDFSEPIYYNELQLVVVKGNEFAYNKFEDLKDRSVGGGTGVSYGPEVDQAIASGAFVLDRDSDATARLQRVLVGQLQVAIIGHGMQGLEYLVQGHPRLSKRRGELSVLPKPLARDPLYLAAPKGMQKKEVLARFSKALHELQRSGQLTINR